MSCSLGIHMVGYTMIAYGVFGGFSSWISGILCEYVGRVALISAGRFCFKKKKIMYTYFQQSEINAFLFPEPIFFSLVDPQYLGIELVFCSRSCTHQNVCN